MMNSNNSVLLQASTKSVLTVLTHLDGHHYGDKGDYGQCY